MMLFLAFKNSVLCSIRYVYHLHFHFCTICFEVRIKCSAKWLCKLPCAIHMHKRPIKTMRGHRSPCIFREIYVMHLRRLALGTNLVLSSCTSFIPFVFFFMHTLPFCKTILSAFILMDLLFFNVYILRGTFFIV